MHPVRKQRLITVIFIVIASTVGIGLVIYSLNENMNLFYPPSKIAAGEAPIGKTIRAGGCVVPGSITRDETSLKVNFAVTDGESNLDVSFEGLLPDLFAEGEAAVLIGQLQNDGSFLADKVLAKHDETYMPPEVANNMPAYNKKGEGAKVGYRDDSASCEVIDYDS